MTQNQPEQQQWSPLVTEDCVRYAGEIIEQGKTLEDFGLSLRIPGNAIELFVNRDLDRLMSELGRIRKSMVRRLDEIRESHRWGSEIFQSLQPLFAERDRNLRSIFSTQHRVLLEYCNHHRSSIQPGSEQSELSDQSIVRSFSDIYRKHLHRMAELKDWIHSTLELVQSRLDSEISEDESLEQPKGAGIEIKEILTTEHSRSESQSRPIVSSGLIRKVVSLDHSDRRIRLMGADNPRSGTSSSPSFRSSEYSLSKVINLETREGASIDKQSALVWKLVSVGLLMVSVISAALIVSAVLVSDVSHHHLNTLSRV